MYKKGIITITTTVFLLLLIVLSFLYLNSKSDIENKYGNIIQSKIIDKNSVEILYIINDTILIDNTNKFELTINNIELNNISCNIQTTLNKSKNIIGLNGCSSNLNSNLIVYSLVIIEEKVFQQYIINKNYTI